MLNRDSKILITGASGFLGSYIYRSLYKAGYTNLLAQKRENSRTDLLSDIVDVNWQTADILDIATLEEVMHEVDYVIHAAAMISMDPTDAETMQKINVTGTANVVNLCLELEVKKLVHISSIAALGRTNNNLSIDESNEWVEHKLNSSYAKSKYLAELEVWRGAAEGLEMIILNPSIILGAGFWSSPTSGLVKTIAKGLAFYPLGSNGAVDVRDVAEAAKRSLEMPISEHRIIVNGQNISYRALFDLFASKLDKPKSKIPLNRFYGNLFWILDALKSKIFRSKRLLSRDSFRITSSASSYNNSKSETLLNMTYRPLEQTISETVSAFKSSKSDYAVFE